MAVDKYSDIIRTINDDDEDVQNFSEDSDPEVEVRIISKLKLKMLET